MKTKTVFENERSQFGMGKRMKQVPAGRLCSTGCQWLVRALAMAVAFTFCQRAPAISPYPGEGAPVLCATVIATGGDVTATFVTGSGCYYDYLYLDTVLPGNPNYSNPGGGSGETANFIF